jgi:hypothetical protein
MKMQKSSSKKQSDQAGPQGGGQLKMQKGDASRAKAAQGIK